MKHMYLLFMGRCINYINKFIYYLCTALFLEEACRDILGRVGVWCLHSCFITWEGGRQGKRKQSVAKRERFSNLGKECIQTETDCTENKLMVTRERRGVN